MSETILMSSFNATNKALQTAQRNAVRLSDSNATYEHVEITTKTADGKITGFSVSPPIGYTNNALSQSIRDSLSSLGYNETLLSKIQDIESVLGQINSPSSFTALFSRFETTLSSFATNPDDLNIKNKLMSVTEQLTKKLNEFEKKIQQIRESCEKDIDTEVKNLITNINIVIKKNVEIKEAVAGSEATSLIKDAMRGALENIANILAVNVTTNEDGSVNVIGPGGINLVSPQGVAATFKRATTINASDIYPDTLNGLVVNNKDITNLITNTGSSNQAKFSALFELRDIILPKLSEAINQLAFNLKEEMNVVHNNASGFPAAQSLTGTKDVVGADTFFGTGNARIATLNKDGIIQHFVDIDVSAQANVNALIATINAGLGGDATASIVNGKLNIKANGALHVAINENTSQILDSAVKVALYDNTGAAIGVYNFNPGVSLANTVATMNAQFGVNAIASLDNGKIHITALNENQLKLNDYPKVEGTTIRSKGLSHYFGLNNFFVGDTNPLSPSIAETIKLNPTLKSNSNLVSISSLDLTANIGQRGITSKGIPGADGSTPAISMHNTVSNAVLFHPTGDIGSKSTSILNYAISVLENISTSSNNYKDKSKESTENFNSNSKEFEKKGRKSIQELTLIIAQFQHSLNTVGSILAKNNELHQKLANIFSR